MDKENRQSEVDDILGASDLMTLVELQKFLADELAGSVESTEDFSRAFLPLTDGLGLESPPKKEMPVAPRPTVPKITLGLPIDFSPSEAQEETEKRPERNQLDALFDGPPGSEARQLEKAPPPAPRNESPAAIPTESRSSAITDKREPATFARVGSFFPDTGELPQPPPVPQASVTRRALAGMADIFFVLTLWLVAVALTSTAMGGNAEGLLSRLPKDLLQHGILRYAMLEYTSIWLVYLIATVGLAHGTVGMWAWGMRVASGEPGESGRWLKKAVRAMVSFLFLAPLLFIPLLVIRIKGRNAIDLLSGTHVYRTAL